MSTPSLRLTALLSSLLVPAPVFAGYEEPDEKAPAAELRIISSTSGVASSSWVDGYSTEACERKKGEGRLATFNLFAKSQKVVRVPVGARLYVLAGAEITPPVGAEEVRQTRCLSMKSVVPEAGKVYEIKHDLITRNCPVEVKDASGAPVATSEKHKPKGLCKEKS